MLNTITVMGRLTRDPELRVTQTQKSVASFTVACERDYAAAGEQKETDFIDCSAFGKTADFVHQYFTKGQMVIVQGRLQLRSWLDKDNQKHNRSEIVADRVWFGESKKKDAEPDAGANFAKEIAEADGDLPF